MQSHKKQLIAAAAAALLVWQSQPAWAAPIIAGQLNVVQNNTSNNSTSVTVTVPVSSGGFTANSGSSDSNGDYDLGSSMTPAGGAVIASVRVNATGSSSTSYVCTPYGTTGYTLSFYEIGAKESDGNVAAAYFNNTQYLAGNLTGSTGGTVVNTTWQGNSNVQLNNQVTPGTSTSGTTTTQLTTVNFTGLFAPTAPVPFTAATSQNGILLVNSFGNNAAVVATSHANSDGTFSVYSYTTTGPTNEQFPVAMAYVPLNDPSTVAMGRIDGDGTPLLGSGSFTITLNATTHQYLLKITGQSDSTGTLIVSGEGQIGSTDADNITTYAWDSAAGGWDVQSSDLPGGGAQALGANNPAFDFVFIAGTPEPSSLGILGLGGLFLLRRKSRQSAR